MILFFFFLKKIRRNKQETFGKARQEGKLGGFLTVGSIQFVISSGLTFSWGRQEVGSNDMKEGERRKKGEVSIVVAENTVDVMGVKCGGSW